MNKICFFIILVALTSGCYTSVETANLSINSHSEICNRTATSLGYKNVTFTGTMEPNTPFAVDMEFYCLVKDDAGVPHNLFAGGVE